MKGLWAFATVCCASAAGAHGFNPSMLELRESAKGHFQGLFRTPLANDEEESHLTPRFPAACREEAARALVQDTFGANLRFQLDCGEGLAGGAFAIDGFRPNDTEVMVRIQWLDGRSVIRVLRPAQPRLEIEAAPDALKTLCDYVRVGVQHILTGYDHLLFVLGLVLLVRSRRSLAFAITAFTVAHSITLGAAVLGWVRCPQPPAEAVIALSIALLAVELARGPESTTLGARRPWLLAMTFGLVHGFGFSGALTQVGLPPGAVPLALFGFNVGVELGQLLCVAVALSVGSAVRAWLPVLWRWGPRPLAYGMGSLAVFWCFERVSAFWSQA